MPTLEELEKDRWGDPPEDATRLIATCHRLRQKAVDHLAAEELRMMLGQAIGVTHLLPRAVALLEQDPLAEGDFYPGDLLHAVIGLDPSSLSAHSATIVTIARRAVDALGGSDAELQEELSSYVSRTAV